MNILGFECGIGSMLIPSKEMEFNIVGGIESRKIFYSGTFEKNFGKKLSRSMPKCSCVDIMFSHPSCGKFSALNSNKDNRESKEFEIVCSAVKLIRPEFFVIDNLPLSLDFYPLKWWQNQLGKEYDVMVEFICNFDYGNVQYNRNRLFIIGAKKKYDYVFVHNINRKRMSVKQVLTDIGNTINNEPMGDDEVAPGFAPYTIANVKSMMKSLKPGMNVKYKNVKGVMRYSNRNIGKTRIGLQIVDLERTAPTITSSLAFYRHDVGRPFTCRERARIQGIPDWFEFVLDQPNGITMGAQTGKCIPVNFIRFITQQIHDYINNKELVYNPSRMTNQIVNRSKFESCLMNDRVREKLCRFCLIENCIKRRVA